MTLQSPPFRMLALVLATVFMIMVTTPAKAEADVLTALAIASLAVAGVILVGYLIIANVTDSRRANDERIVWVACTGADCAARIARSPELPSSIGPESP